MWGVGFKQNLHAAYARWQAQSSIFIPVPHAEMLEMVRQQGPALHQRWWLDRELQYIRRLRLNDRLVFQS